MSPIKAKHIFSFQLKCYKNIITMGTLKALDKISIIQLIALYLITQNL